MSARDTKASISKVELSHQCLDVYWQDGSSSAFDYLWLRDNCPSAFHPQTHERNFNLLSIDENIRPQKASTDGDRIDIVWDDHNSTFFADWLAVHDYSHAVPKSVQPQPQLWTGDFSAPEYDFAAVCEQDDMLLECLSKLESTGLILITAMPADQGLERLVERISHIRVTNFGRTFEVISKPDPNNQAYTADTLPLHTDLPNQELIPGYQFLQCVDNSSTGGESLLVDGFSVAELLRSDYPQDFELLCKQPISFRFHDQTHDLKQRKYIISVDDNNQLEQITFNAHLAEPFDLPSNLTRPFYRAYRRFMQLLKSEHLVLTFKLTAGSMMVFNNRRVLHGRNAFDPNSGFRHLRGCYVDIADVSSKIRVLQREHISPPG